MWIQVLSIVNRKQQYEQSSMDQYKNKLIYIA